MSVDNERRARELLAAEYERDGFSDVAREVRLESSDLRALRAIMAALDEPAGSVGGEAVACRAAIKEVDGQPNGLWIYNDDPDYYRGSSSIVTEKLYTHPAPPVVDEAMVERMAKWMCRSEAGDRAKADLETMITAMSKWPRYKYEARDALTSALTQPSQPVTFQGIPVVENPDMAPDEVVAFNRPSQPGEEG